MKKVRFKQQGSDTIIAGNVEVDKKGELLSITAIPMSNGQQTGLAGFAFILPDNETQAIMVPLESVVFEANI